MVENDALYSPQPVTIALLKALAKAPPPAIRKDVRDRGTRLIVTHEKSGHLALHVELGRGRRKRLCDARRVIEPSSKVTLAMVKNQAAQLLGQQAGGRDFSAELRADRAVPTLRAFVNDTYGPWARMNRRSGPEAVDRIKAVFESLLGTKLSDLTPAKLEPWRERRQRTGVAPETINRNIDALRAALTRAVKLQILSKNPLLGIERAEVDRHKQVVRSLTAAEKGDLLAALASRDDKKREQRANANEWRRQRDRALLPLIGRFADLLTPAVIVSLETGLRRNELLSLQWGAVDLGAKAKTLRVHGATSKTYETRDIPLNKLAHETLRDWWLQCGQPDDGHVFTLHGEPVASLKKSYHGILAAAGINRVNRKGERVNWHSLRHTFGSLLGAAGVDATTLMKLMGHANLETTQRYLHTDEERMRAAVEQLA
jgi:integrase